MHRLIRVLVILMIVQATVGLVMPAVYRDPGWIKATWLGNDWITLIVAVPLLAAAARMAQSGSQRGMLLKAGVVSYAIYNYAFYLFGASLNACLPLYAITLWVAMLSLGSVLSRVDPLAVARSANPALPARLLGGYLLLVAAGLALVWLGMWAAYVFAGRPTPVEPNAFKIVAALDLLWLVPSLAAGGMLLWNRSPWGLVIASAASVQGTVYLLVLTVNSVIAIHQGFATSPGELPIWIPLTVLTAAAALTLLRGIGGREPRGMQGWDR
jgi:hypothetical protein